MNEATRDICISTLNVFIMLWIIIFAAYLSAELSNQKIRIWRRLYWAVKRKSLQPFRDIKAHKRIFLWFYALIPVLLMNVLVISRQFRIGKMYIRADISFITAALFWSLFPIVVMGFIKKSKQQHKK